MFESVLAAMPALSSVGDILGSLNGISGAVSGLFGGGGSANRYATEAARESMAYATGEANKARDFNSIEAAAQRNWAKSMSETSYQRAVGDLKAAGLNPMLAVQQGGASTPSGASSGSSPSPQGTALAASAKELVNAQIRATNAQAAESMSRAKVNEAEIPVKTQTAANLKEEILLISQNVRKAMEETREAADRAADHRASERLKDKQGFLTDAQRDLAYIQASLAKGHLSVAEAEAKLIAVHERLAKLGVSKASAISDVYKTDAGKKVLPWLSESAGAVSSAGSLLRSIGPR